ncbi:MAG: Trk family potassium uptake protein [Clostridia bacterium]|nr:Trk family potassium uptake protein [Clostridia bacterium]
MSATQVILIGFIMLILLGTLLLMLPISSQDGTPTSLRSSLFTATSATCVTGLIVEDTGTHWSVFGQIVIITLIQIGGLGFMTMAVMMSIFIKRQITPRERLLVAQSLGLTGVGGTVKLVRRILIGTFTIEGIGAVVLATQFVPIFGWAKGIYYGIFHSISSFCNAGFDILDGTAGYGGNFSSMTSLRGNPVITVTLMLLIIIGGIGFIVWDDIVNFIKERKRFSVYTRLVLSVSAMLIFTGALLIALFEWNNPNTIGNMSLGDKILQCLFQSVTTRTAGIDMINNNAMTESSKLISMLLMFIGGASGSTAGGIKVGTFAVVICAVIAFAKGEKELVIRHRHIPHGTVVRALTVIGIDIFAVLTSALIITGTTGAGVIDALYETFSGIATVGLSLSLTPTLSLAGHIAVILLMFFGRVGVLTITYSILLKQAKKNSFITYPEINMMIG